MDFNQILGLFLIGAVCVVFGEEPIKVTPEGDVKRIVNVGDSVELKCQTNKGMVLFFDYKLQWWHKSMVDPDNAVETKLADQGTLTDAASPDVFEAIATRDEPVFYALKVKSVKANHDGMFICRFVPNKPDERDQVQMEFEFVIKNDVQGIGFVFDGEKPVTNDAEQTVERTEGDYGAKCMAMGFAPNAGIQMFLDDEELSSGGTDISSDMEASKASGQRLYTAQAEVKVISLKKRHKKISIPLHIIQLKPTIKCEVNNSAHVGDKYVKLTCIVNHATVDVDHYAFEIGESGEVITKDGKSKNFHELKVKTLDSGRDEVTLDLYQVDKWHFNTPYYLDVFLVADEGEDPEKFRKTTTLIMLESTSEATLTMVSLGLVLSLSALLSLLFSL